MENATADSTIKMDSPNMAVCVNLELCALMVMKQISIAEDPIPGFVSGIQTKGGIS